LRLTRRALVQAGLATAAAPALSIIGGRVAVSQPAAPASAPVWRHGLSLFGDLHYPADFKHFDYVNPAAPKTGTVRLGAGGQTFDNFNIAVAGVKGNIAAGVQHLYDTLTTGSLDEVSSEYGLLAEAVSYPDDFSSVTYRLRSNARWHDGKPITPDDVIYSFDVSKKNNPQLAAYYRHVTKAEKTSEREITFTFDQTGNRELPLIIGQIVVLPKHYWEGSDNSGNKRNINGTTLEPPLGCGAYRIKDFTAGRSIVYERVQDYWGKDVNVNIGVDNFDQIRYEYFRDTTVALEALKADQLDWRTENSAKNWATSYDFPAVKEKRVLLEEFAIRNMGVMQAFVLNTRRDKFKDARVRRAFNYALDFEEMNKQLFYGTYKRIASYFEGTELAARDLPQGEELQILESVRDKVPPEVFTTPYTNPVGGNSENVRNNLREAIRLLKEAGYEIRDRKLVNAKTGEKFNIEFLVQEPTFERVVLFYKPSLERLGIEVSVRTVDDAQYENRVRNWEFDIVIETWPQSLSPGNEQRAYWGSQAADQPGSRNLAGIKNPAVDELVDRVIFAKNRSELVAATKALDRVLLWNYYVVPQWHYPYARTVRWNRFGKPEKMPAYGASAFPTVWWWDAEKAAKTGSRS
jgi:microcin C transport system substrate-binding protein